MLKIPYNLGIHIHLSSVLFIVGRYTYLTLMMNHCRNLIKSKYIPTYLKKIITIEKCHKKWSSTLEVEDSISVKTNRNWKKKKKSSWLSSVLSWAICNLYLYYLSLSSPSLYLSLCFHFRQHIVYISFYLLTLNGVDLFSFSPRMRNEDFHTYNTWLHRYIG